MKSGHKKLEHLGAEDGREPRTTRVRTTTSGLDVHVEELTGIDWADLLDPAEFGYRRLQGRFNNLWLP